MVAKQHFAGKVVVITGGGRGIGLATAKGARISIGDVQAELAVKEAAELNGYGGQLDVRDRASFSAFLSATSTALGSVDVLINNAGIMPTGDFTEESDDMSDAQIDVNLRGVILGCKLALPGMIHRGQGHIVNVASMAGVLPVPGLAVYCATKFAVVGLTQALREEYRDSGVHFSTIMPAKVTTELAAGTEVAGRGVPTSSPEQVAAAIVEAVREQLNEVTVPRYMAVTPALLGVAPQRLQRGIRRLLGDRRILEKLDNTARADYDARIAQLANK